MNHLAALTKLYLFKITIVIYLRDTYIYNMCDETSLCTFNGINVIYSSQIVIFHKSCNEHSSFQEIQCDPHKQKVTLECVNWVQILSLFRLSDLFIIELYIIYILQISFIVSSFGTKNSISLEILLLGLW